MPTTRIAAEYLADRAQKYSGRAVILGKGPSFAEFDPRQYGSTHFIVGLNETALRVRCHAAFIIDEEILDRNAEALAAQLEDGVITPRVMHRKTLSVGNLIIYGPVSKANGAAAWTGHFSDRIFQFNLGTAPAAPALGEALQAGNFSAPILARALARAGFTDITLAGVDGGSRYSTEFKEFEFKKLRSVQDSFDPQFKELRGVRDQYGVTFRSVRCCEPWVLIGTEPEQVLATEVLKWSIETRTFLTVRYCQASAIARSLYAGGTAGTPFSFQRIFLPQIAGHKGRGVYFDSDMLVFRDVYELFNWDMRGNVLMSCGATPGRKAQYSVFLVDNERASWDGDALLADYRAGRVTYESLLGQFSFAHPKSNELPMEWNSLEMYEVGDTANIHFTDMGTQPWLSIYNPNAGLWCEALFEAYDARTTVREALELSLQNSWVRPSLKWQVENRRADPWQMPRAVKSMDRAWVPPHVKLRISGEPGVAQRLKWRLASQVRRMMQSRTYRRCLRIRDAIDKVF